jgi:hypothetical protein
MTVTPASIDRSLKDKAFRDLAAGRAAADYFPPLGYIEDLNADLAMDLAAREEIANERKVRATIVMLEEVDCTSKRRRFLEIHSYAKDRHMAGMSRHATGWEYITPQTNDNSLWALVCDPHKTSTDNRPAQQRAKSNP